MSKVATAHQTAAELWGMPIKIKYGQEPSSKTNGYERVIITGFKITEPCLHHFSLQYNHHVSTILDKVQSP